MMFNCDVVSWFILHFWLLVFVAWSQGCITALCSFPAGGFVSTGSDGQVTVWLSTMEVRTSVELGVAIKRAMKQAESEFEDEDSENGIGKRRNDPLEEEPLTMNIYAVDHNGDFVLSLGTSTNHILELDLRTRHCHVIASHPATNVKALAVHPRDHEFITGSQPDPLHHTPGFVGLVVWDYKTHSKVAGRSRATEAGISALTYNTKGECLAAGLENGKVLVLDSYRMSIVSQIKTGDSHVNAIKFSLDGSVLAAACGTTVYICNVNRGTFAISPALCLEGHTAVIIDLTFSVDGTYLQSTDQECNMHYC